MSWFSKRWVPRWELEGLEQANTSVQGERDRYRARQEGHDVLCGFMKLAGIDCIDESISGDGHKIYTVTYRDGRVKTLGAHTIGRWPSDYDSLQDSGS